MKGQYVKQQSHMDYRSRASKLFGQFEKENQWASNYSDVNVEGKKHLISPLNACFITDLLCTVWNKLSHCFLTQLPKLQLPYYLTFLELVYLSIPSACNRARRECPNDQKCYFYRSTSHPLSESISS